MDRIASLGVFAKVVAKQSFSGAARELRLSQAAVSKHVRALEDWLGVRLLNRTTRRLNVTEAGALVYERCERILGEIDEVEQSASVMQAARRAAPCGAGLFRQKNPARALDAVRWTSALRQWQPTSLPKQAAAARIAIMLQWRPQNPAASFRQACL